jgi:hypothetical protein
MGKIGNKGKGKAKVNANTPKRMTRSGRGAPAPRDTARTTARVCTARDQFEQKTCGNSTPCPDHPSWDRSAHAKAGLPLAGTEKLFEDNYNTCSKMECPYADEEGEHVPVLTCCELCMDSYHLECGGDSATYVKRRDGDDRAYVCSARRSDKPRFEQIPADLRRPASVAPAKPKSAQELEALIAGERQKPKEPATRPSNIEDEIVSTQAKLRELMRAKSQEATGPPDSAAVSVQSSDSEEDDDPKKVPTLSPIKSKTERKALMASRIEGLEEARAATLAMYAEGDIHELQP